MEKEEVKFIEAGSKRDQKIRKYFLLGLGVFVVIVAITLIFLFKGLI